MCKALLHHNLIDELLPKLYPSQPAPNTTKKSDKNQGLLIVIYFVLIQFVTISIAVFLMALHHSRTDDGSQDEFFQK